MDAPVNHIHLCVPTCRYTTVLPATSITLLKYLSSEPSGRPKKPMSGFMKYLQKQRPVTSTQYPGRSETHCQFYLACWWPCQSQIATSSSRFKIRRCHKEGRRAVEKNEPRGKAGIASQFFYLFFCTD